MKACGWANRAWAACNARRARAFDAALGDPRRVQAEILRRCLAANADTVIGRRHGFASIGCVSEFQRRVPLWTYDDYGPLIGRVRAGEPRVLTGEPVTRLIPSSGSTAARKLIPYTRGLQAQFNAAIGPWIVDLFRRYPALRDGPAYWSVSPALPEDRGDSAVPIGFEHDSAYLGAWLSRLVDATLAVPAAVQGITHVEAFRYATALHLLAARELRLISIWHPSFFTLLLDTAAQHWERLLDDVARGDLNPPGPVSAVVRRALLGQRRQDAPRAEELRRLGPADVAAFWPRLALVSCWADGHSGGAARALARRFPSVPLQPKGLLATEAFVTLPSAGRRPLAIRSHFFEFLDDAGEAHLAHELRAGGDYAVVVTTAGGLYRYRLGDRVRVEGYSGRTPSLAFLGREDRVSDRFGEKLGEAFVAAALRKVLGPLADEADFAMLAPDGREGGRRWGYTLYVDVGKPLPSDLAIQLDAALGANPHYRWCRELGQLAPASVFQVRGGAHERYLEHRCSPPGDGTPCRRLGHIKPAVLSDEAGWSQRFSGAYVQTNEQSDARDCSRIGFGHSTSDITPGVSAEERMLDC